MYLFTQETKGRYAVLASQAVVYVTRFQNSLCGSHPIVSRSAAVRYLRPNSLLTANEHVVIKSAYYTC